jgi:hypothetical protein
MGFKSTVPPNANELLAQAVNSAYYNGGNFPSTSVTAPENIPTNQPGYGVLNNEVSVASPPSSSGITEAPSNPPSEKNGASRTAHTGFLSHPFIIIVATCITLLCY